MVLWSRLVQKSFYVARRLLKKVVSPTALMARLPLSDSWYIRWRYALTFGRPLDLEDPQTFTAKIQWLKLYGRPDQYAHLADKYAVYDYVRVRAGERYLNRLLGVYTRAADIHWDDLPDQFVLKATHASGWNLLVRDKARLDRERAARTCHQWLTSSYYARRHEPVYRTIPPRIICEEYLGDPDTELFDYKLYCFDGKVRLIHVDTERFINHQRTYFTPEWERLPFSYAYPTRPEPLPKPEALSEMIAVAERLAGTMPLVRVDLYYIRRRIIFGEMTFYPDDGFGAFNPPEWDRIIGSYLHLPPRQD